MGLFGNSKKKAEADVGPLGTVTLSDGQEVEVSARIDCLGDSCPRPQLLTKKALGNAAANDVLEILIDNPSSMEAIPPMLRGLGATHLETIKDVRRWGVYVRKD